MHDAMHTYISTDVVIGEGTVVEKTEIVGVAPTAMAVVTVRSLLLLPPIMVVR